MSLILAPCHPQAEPAFLKSETDEYPLMSGRKLITTATVLLDRGMLEMKEPTTKLALDTAAGNHVDASREAQWSHEISVIRANSAMVLVVPPLEIACMLMIPRAIFTRGERAFGENVG